MICFEGRNLVRRVGVGELVVVTGGGVEVDATELVTVWPFCFCVRRDFPVVLGMMVACFWVGEFIE